MSLFGGPEPIVSWAPYNTPIPITCMFCGAVFITRNSRYIGSGPVYFGDDEEKCRKCNKELVHNVLECKPDYGRYLKGVFE